MSATLTRVSMSLRDRDIENTHSVRQLFHVKTNVDAVCAALDITRSLGEMLKGGKELFLRNKKGELKRVFISGLDDDSE